MIQHVEVRGSRGGTDATDRSSTGELVWSVWGSNDLDECRDYLHDVVPTFYDGLVFKSLSWEHLGNETWEFRATYIHPDKKDRDDVLDVGDYTFSFDTGSGTVKRQCSLATTGYGKSGATAPDFKGLIGVTKDSVEGVEIGVRALKFSIRKRVPRATITFDYVVLLHNMTFTVNNATFLGFAAGELLFTGASGSQATESDPEVTYNFIASPNDILIPIGDIVVISKKGHDYLWVYCEEEEDATANMTVKRPLAAYVEQVYTTSNFSDLGILG